MKNRMRPSERIPRAAAALAALLLALPGPGSASGSWMTVTENLTAEAFSTPDAGYSGTVTMTFLGDCTLGGEEKKAGNSLSFARRISENGMDFPFRGLTELTGKDDLTVANLEGVLSDRKLKKEKKEFNFIGSADYAGILTAGSVECVTLANNHTRDYGEEGYRETKEALEREGVCWFGTDAPAVWRSGDGVMIGFLGVNYSLTGNRAKRYARQAEKLRELGCAAIVTVMHAGTEYSRTPPDAFQKQIVSRAVKAGSCLVVGHHPHVVQGVSLADGIPVIYSLGNCAFGGTTYARDTDALAVRAELVFRDGELRRTELTFFPISVTSDARHNNYSPCLLKGEDAERVLQKMEKSTGTDPGRRNPDGSATLVVEREENGEPEEEADG